MSVDTKRNRTSSKEIQTSPEHLNYIKVNVTGTLAEVLETLEECEILLRENQNLHKTRMNVDNQNLWKKVLCISNATRIG